MNKTTANEQRHSKEAVDESEIGSTSSSWHKNFEIAEDYKMEGNEYYKSKEYKRAIRKYHQALLHLRGIISNQQLSVPMLMPKPKEIPAEAMLQINQLLTDCNSNLAACLLQLSEPSYSRVLECCDKALELSPSNAKALFRKGVALYHLQKPEECLKILQKASSLPGAEHDAKIIKYIRLCNEEITRQEDKLKDQYKAMFADPKRDAL